MKTREVRQGTTIDLDELRMFVYGAKVNTYASGGGKVPESKIWVPGNREHEYEKRGFYYRDSYCGYLSAPGREWVKIGGPEGLTVWSMSYDGGMSATFADVSADNVSFASETFRLLKSALCYPPLDLPARGPEGFKTGATILAYQCKVEGTFERFNGEERILQDGIAVFMQQFAGGVVIYK